MFGVSTSSFPYPNCKQCTNKCVIPVAKGKRLQGKQVEPVCCFLKTGLPSGTFEDILNGIQNRIEHASRLLYPKIPRPSDQALKNLRGGWFETLIAAIAWNSAVGYNKTHGKKVALINLPDARTMQFWEFYGGKAETALNELFSALKNFDMNITLSNPDLICIRGIDSNLATNFEQPIKGLTPDEVARIENAYKLLKKKCGHDSIVFGIAVKLVLAPDRRYQIVYEGSLLKAIVAHLRTRFWMPSLEARYYGLVSKPMSDQDKKVFTNPSIDTIIDVRSQPRKAVDEAITCRTVSEAESTIKKWLSTVA